MPKNIICSKCFIIFLAFVLVTKSRFGSIFKNVNLLRKVCIFYLPKLKLSISITSDCSWVGKPTLRKSKYIKILQYDIFWTFNLWLCYSFLTNRSVGFLTHENIKDAVNGNIPKSIRTESSLLHNYKHWKKKTSPRRKHYRTKTSFYTLQTIF